MTRLHWQGENASEHREIEDQLFPHYDILQPHQRRFLEQLAGGPLRNPAIFEQALIHGSYLGQLPATVQPRYSNERLEFLGDALLGLIVGETLFWSIRPVYTEGELTQMRAQFVRTSALVYCARRLELERYLFVNAGIAQMLKQQRAEAVLADALEALIGAIYLDQGMEAAVNFVKQHIIEPLSPVLESESSRDHKSELQRYSQSAFQGVLPEYQVIKEEGPSHDKIYVVQVQIKDIVYGIGRGKSKQEAEQQAAYRALVALGQISS